VSRGAGGVNARGVKGLRRWVAGAVVAVVARDGVGSRSRLAPLLQGEPEAPV